MKGAGTALKVDVDVSQSAESITIKDAGAAREPVGEAHVLPVSYDAAQPSGDHTR